MVGTIKYHVLINRIEALNKATCSLTAHELC